MPARNRRCYICGYQRPSWTGEDATAGRGVAVWVCADCARDPETGLRKRHAAQAKAAERRAASEKGRETAV